MELEESEQKKQLILTGIIPPEMENESEEVQHLIYMKTRSRLAIGGENQNFDIDNIKSRKEFYEKIIMARWKYIEQPLNSSEQRVCQTLENTAIRITGIDKDITETGLKVCGEEVYVTYLKKYFLQDIYNLPKVKTEKKQKQPAVKGQKKEKKPKPPSKETQMKMKILCQKIHSVLKDQWGQFADNLQKTLNDGDQTKLINLVIDKQCEFEEIKVITLLMVFHHFKETVKLRECVQIIETIKNQLEKYSSICGQCIYDEKQKDMLFSSSLVDDINYIYENYMMKLYEENGINNLSIILSYPDIVIQTRYQHNFNISGGVQMYESQLEVLNKCQNFYQKLIKKPKTTAKLIFYKSMVGSGKTTLVIGLAKMLQQWREMHKGMKNVQLIFCSPQKDVRNYIGRLAYNSDISFGVMFSKKDDYMEKVTVSNNARFKNEAFPVLLITYPQALSCRLSVKNRNCILFYDEPTIDTDQADPFFTKNLINTLPIFPKLTILASATIPNIEDVPNFVQLYKNTYKEADIEIVYSQEFKIGLRGYDMETGVGFIPHQYCKSKKDLEKLVVKLNQNPFLKRFYHGEIVYKLCNYLKKYENKFLELKREIPNINKLNVLNQNEITKMAMQTIDLMIYCLNDEEIKDVCSGLTQKIEPINNIVCQQYRFDKGCLIATDQPFEYTYDRFNGIYQKGFKDNLENFDKLKQEFLLRDHDFQRQMDKMEDKYKELQDKYLNSTKNISKEKLDLYREEIKQLEASVKPPTFNFDEHLNLQEKDDGIKIIDVKNLINSKKLGFKDYQTILGLSEFLQNIDLEFKLFSDKHLTLVLNSLCQNCKNCKDCYPDLDEKENLEDCSLTNCHQCKECPICPINKKHCMNTKLCKSENTCDLCQGSEQLSCEKCSQCENCNNPDNKKALKLFYENLPLFNLAIYSHEYDVDTLSQFLEYVNRQQLKFLVSSDRVCYGVNMAVQHVVVEDDMAESHSINTLFQLMGRAGRVGISNQGFIYFGKKMTQKMTQFLTEDEVHLEANIFEKYAQATLNRIQELKQQNQEEN